MGDELRRQALARDLARRLQLASIDELRVIDALLARLELGRERYGQLVLAKDRRDWRRERREELLDAIVYEIADELVAQEVERAELHEAARREMVGEPDELAVLTEWEAADRRTTISGETLAIARTVTAERSEPYETVVIEPDSEAG